MVLKIYFVKKFGKITSDVKEKVNKTLMYFKSTVTIICQQKSNGVKSI